MMEKPKTRQWVKDAQAGKTLINNSDGSVSTVRTISFEADGKFYVAPTIRLINGKPTELSEKEAVDYGFERNDLPSFKTQKEADSYAQSLHESEERRTR